MESIFQYPNVLIMLGLVAIAIDVAILGFASFVLTILGSAILLTGLLMLVGLVPETTASTLWSAGILTALLTLLLWKPLRNLQNKTQGKAVEQDFADKQFVLPADVDAQGFIEHQYSGVRWKLKSQQPLTAGTLVRIERIEVGVLWVVAVPSV